MEYDDLCKEILKIDPKIRFAGVCDETGEIRHGGMREGVPNLLTPEEIKKSMMGAMARWRLRNSASSRIGRAKYAMAEHEKIKRVTFPMDEKHLLLVTTEVDADHTKIIDGILRLKKDILYYRLHDYHAGKA